ncbi:unnamed protein product, partial [marine sediment metagenome]
MSQKKDRAINGSFDSEYHGWIYKSNNPTEYIDHTSLNLRTNS